MGRHGFMPLTFLRKAMIHDIETAVGFDSSIERQAAVSAALVSVFRGKFCNLILPDKKSKIFKKHQVIYEVGDKERTFIFLQTGFAKVGTITTNGREVIYDVRKGGDVVGELCASEHVRLDRAVALEESQSNECVPFRTTSPRFRRRHHRHRREDLQGDRLEIRQKKIGVNRLAAQAAGDPRGLQLGISRCAR
jgi:hypothetical protein